MFKEESAYIIEENSKMLSKVNSAERQLKELERKISEEVQKFNNDKENAQPMTNMRLRRLSGDFNSSKEINERLEIKIEAEVLKVKSELEELFAGFKKSINGDVAKLNQELYEEINELDT